MLDDTPSSVARRRIPKQNTRRIYIVVNPNPEGDEDGPHPSVPPSRLPHVPKAAPSPTHPGFINTNLKPTSPHPPYNNSDRTVSSPSTPTSSPAVESTPPSSTPGQKSGPSVDHNSDRSDGYPPANTYRAENTFPPSFAHGRRGSVGQNGPLSHSPVYQESSLSAKPESARSPPSKIQILITAEAEDYKMVDITDARDPAFIRERIFSKLRISDDEQEHFSIYRTEVGCFALSESLADEQLFNLCMNQGDPYGKLKFLVTYSSAQVHESPPDSAQSQTITSFPPPVLPRTPHGILSPGRKQRARSLQRSLSSASERIPQEAGTGYDASVSDDLDNVDKDTSRTTIRPYPYQPISDQIPASLRPHSPLNTHSQEKGRTLPPDMAPRLDKGHLNLLSSQPISPSNARSYFPEDNHGTFTRKSPAATSTAEREKTMEHAENKSDVLDQQWRHVEADKEKRRDGQQRKTANEKDKEHWTVVPPDVPHSDYKKERPSAHEPIRSSSIRRNQVYTERSFGGPRNQPGEGRRRPIGQPVPSHWAVSWRPGGKTDQNLSPTLPSLYRGIKSMDNLRTVAKPATLRPGVAPPLPSIPLVPQMASTLDSSDHTFNSPAQFQRNEEPRTIVMSPVSGSSRPLPLVGNASSTSLGITSPSADHYSRPRSAMGDSAASPHPSKPRQTQSPAIRSDADSQLSSASRPQPSSLSPHVGYAPNSRSTYGHEGSQNATPRIVHFPHNSEDRSTDTGLENVTVNTTLRTPSSPVSPYSISSDSSQADVSIRLSSPLEPGTEISLRIPFQKPRTTPMVDAPSTESTLIPRKERSEIKPLPPYPVPRHPQNHSHSPLPPLPVPPPQLPPSAESSAHIISPTPVAAPHIVATTSSVPAPAADKSDESDGSNSGTLWAIGSNMNAAGTWQQWHVDKRKSMRGPQLTVQIEKPTVPQSTNGAIPASTLPQVPEFLPPEYPPHQSRRGPKSHKGSNSIGATIVRPPNRTSVFNEDFRPPPEEMYERLGEFFPEHDLDKPVIEASSGGTSPTSADYMVAPPLLQLADRRKHKKSIRVVANEHKKRLDRSSKAAASNAANNMLRKRSTKMWGSKLEEVTAEQVRAGLITIADSTGPKPIFKWVRGELIGRGTYGKVYVALNATTGEMIAVKQVEIPRTESDRNDSRQITVVEALKLESETLKDLDHPNIVQYLGFEETPKFLSIFLEYVPGGSVASCLRRHGRFNENVTKSFTGQILDGLEYLHSKGILHRDLKADNILVESFGLCKISDFGISKRTDDINMIGAYTSMQGSVFWMAPEVVSKKRGYNSKIDIWSVGCVVFEMWTGQRPWNGQEAVAVLMQLYQSKVSPPVPSDMPLSALADDFRKQCFATNPDERPTAAVLRNHAYLSLPPSWEFTDFV